MLSRKFIESRILFHIKSLEDIDDKIKKSNDDFEIDWLKYKKRGINKLISFYIYRYENR